MLCRCCYAVLYCTGVAVLCRCYCAVQMLLCCAVQVLLCCADVAVLCRCCCAGVAVLCRCCSAVCCADVTVLYAVQVLLCCAGVTVLYAVQVLLGVCGLCSVDTRQRVYLEWVGRVCTWLRAAHPHVTPIIWDDMLRSIPAHLLKGNLHPHFSLISQPNLT